MKNLSVRNHSKPFALKALFDSRRSIADGTTQSRAQCRAVDDEGRADRSVPFRGRSASAVKRTQIVFRISPASGWSGRLLAGVLGLLGLILLILIILGLWFVL